MLIDNAVQFSDDGAEVVVDARAEADGEQVVLCVTDQGRGIPEDELETIFEPFFMVGSHHQLEGFGLSLPMARVLIEQVGGQIWAQSPGRGKGASLCIRLRAQPV